MDGVVTRGEMRWAGKICGGEGVMRKTIFVYLFLVRQQICD